MDEINFVIQIDRIIPVTNEEELMSFAHLFTNTTIKNLSDNHLWLSVVAKPIHSRFTCVERVACCLLLLFLTMLGSCMFYKGESPMKQPNLFSVGPFALTSNEV